MAELKHNSDAAERVAGKHSDINSHVANEACHLLNQHASPCKTPDSAQKHLPKMHLHEDAGDGQHGPVHGGGEGHNQQQVNPPLHFHQNSGEHKHSKTKPDLEKNSEAKPGGHEKKDDSHGREQSPQPYNRGDDPPLFPPMNGHSPFDGDRDRPANYRNYIPDAQVTIPGLGSR